MSIEKNTVNMAKLVNVGEEFKDIHYTSLSTFLYWKIFLQRKK